MKIRFQDNSGIRYIEDVAEVIVFDDNENPISISIENGELVTSANASDKDFATVLSDSGLKPSKIVRI